RFEEGDQVDGMAPVVELFGAATLRQDRDEAGEDGGGGFAVPTDEVEEFAGFVDEVEGVAAVEVVGIGGAGEEEGGDLGGGGAGVDGGEEGALGAVGVADFDELAEPGFEARRQDVRGREGIEGEAGRLTGAVAGDVDESVVEGKGAVV